jgi:RNA polymerase sigma-70 factor, ECF subfamily
MGSTVGEVSLSAHASWLLRGTGVAAIRDDADTASASRRNSIPIQPPSAGSAQGQNGSPSLIVASLESYSDHDLLRAAAGGNSAAFHSLMDRHAKGLFRLALSLSATRADAEDICQETFVGAYRASSHFEGKASVKTWLTRILIRRAAKHWHKTRNDRKTVSLHTPGEDDSSSDRQDSVPTPASCSPSVDHKLDLASVIQTLAPDYRQVIVLREMQGLSYEEIAAALSIPRGTVESRLHRARAELRVLLKDYKPVSRKAAGASVPRSAS